MGDKSTSHPYVTTGDYSYINERDEGKYPVPRLNGLEHFGNWPRFSYNLILHDSSTGGDVILNTIPVLEDYTLKTEDFPTADDLQFVKYTTEKNGTGADNRDYTSEDGKNKILFADMDGNLDLYAYWYATLNYDLNDNTEEPASMTGYTSYRVERSYESMLDENDDGVPKATSATITTDEPVRDGYLFLGWSEENGDNRGKETYRNHSGSALKKSIEITTNKTLYAVWQEKYLVTYNANVPTSSALKRDLTPTQSEHLENDSVKVPTIPAERDTGYCLTDASGNVTHLFRGWSTNNKAAAADPSYAPGQTFTMPADNVRLYAVWERCYRVIYDVNCYDTVIKGAVNDLISQRKITAIDNEVYLQGDKAELVEPSQMILSNETETYEFVGWTDKNDGTEANAAYAPGKQTPITDDLPLYAVWKQSKNTVKITVKLDGMPWDGLTVKLRGDGKTYDPSAAADGVYTFTQVESGENGISYTVTINDVSVGSSVLVTKGRMVEKEYRYYTILTRYERGINNTNQIGASGASAIPLSVPGYDTACAWLENTAVTLTATPEGGKLFKEWIQTADETSVWEQDEHDADENYIIAVTKPEDLTALSNLYKITYVLVGAEPTGDLLGDAERLNNDKTKRVEYFEGGIAGSDLISEFKAEEFYKLPGNALASRYITVTVNGVALASADYKWECTDELNGTLTVQGEAITGATTIILRAIPETYDIYYDKYPKNEPYKDPIMPDFEVGSTAELNEDILKGMSDDQIKQLFNWEPYSDATLAFDSIEDGGIEGEILGKYADKAYVTVIADSYYSLPESVTIWCVNEVLLEGGVSYFTRQKLEEGTDYTYNFTDADGVLHETGIIVFQEKHVPGTYVVIEGECKPTQYSVNVELTGADIESVEQRGELVSQTEWSSLSCTHFDENDTVICLQAWQYDETQGQLLGYTLPEKILVKIGGSVAGPDQYTYDRTSGTVTLKAGAATGDIQIIVVCDETVQTSTVFLYKDSVAWSGQEVELHSSSTVIEPKQNQGAAYCFGNVLNGTYDIYVKAADGNYYPVGKTLTKTEGSASSASVYFYTVDLTAGAGIDTVSVDSAAHVFAEQSVSCRTYLAGSTVTLQAVPEAHAAFREWKRGMESYSSSAEFIVNRLTANLSLAAEAEYNRYTITYQEADGRPVDNAEFVSEPPSGYVYRTGAALPALQREGYTFAGWYEDAAFKNRIYDDNGYVDHIAASKAGDLVVYAKWEATIYDIRLQLNGGNSVNAATNLTWVSESADTFVSTYTVADAVKLPSGTRDGHEQVGWQIVSTTGSWPVNTVFTDWSEPLEAGYYGDVTLKAF